MSTQPIARIPRPRTAAPSNEKGHQWVAAALMDVGRGAHIARAEHAARTGHYVVPAATRMEVLEVYCSRCRVPFSRRAAQSPCTGVVAFDREWTRPQLQAAE